MSFAITGLYASLLALLLIVLGARVSILRARTGVSILHGDNMELAERIRIHANLAESLPVALILMGIAEAQGASATVMHSMGIILLVSRLVHPFGIRHDKANEVLRGVGSAGTTIAQLIAIGYIAWRALA